MSSEASYSDADDFDSKTPAGSMQLHDFADGRNPMPGFFKDGCSYAVDRDGKVDLSQITFSDCKAADGAVMRQKLLGGTSPAPAAKTVSTGSPAPKAATACETNLKAYAADQLLALASEYIQTGQIDLAAQVRSALLSRFPNSPLVPVVAQMMANAFKPAGPKAGAATLTASLAAPPSVSAPAAPSLGGAVDAARLLQLTDAMDYSSRILSEPGQPLNFEITTKSGMTDVPIAIVVSANGKFISLSVPVGPVSAAKASAALAKVAAIQPTMIWTTDRDMYFGSAIDNRPPRRHFRKFDGSLGPVIAAGRTTLPRRGKSH